MSERLQQGKFYHSPKRINYKKPLCGQWSMYTELKISKVSPTCKKCLKELDRIRTLKELDTSKEESVGRES